MNATLSFNLPEEQVEFDMASRAVDMNSLIFELDQELRNCLRYDSHPEWDSVTVEKIRELLNEMIHDRQIRFN
jgi:hypothetical protein